MTSARPINVLLVEDHVVVRQGLRALLEMDGRFVIAGEARNGREAVELARRLRPDVILMDIAMPMLNGAEASRQILAARPTTRIVVLSAYSDDIYVDRMVQAGVAGFLEKQTSAEILTRAMREVAAGRTFFSPVIARRRGSLQNSPRNGSGKRNAKARGLTPRELEVLQLVAEGSANKQIAAALRISIKTVEKHRQHLMNKLEIHDTASLTRYAITAGIIEGNVRLIIT